MSSQNGQTAAAADEAKKQSEQDSQKPKIDWKLLDQQNAELDGDLDYESDSDHDHGCSCCAGLVGTIQ